MPTTSASLFQRLRGPAPADADWRLLHDIYHPLIRATLIKSPDLRADADDLAQEVFLVLLRELSSFDRQHCGSFRVWLRRIVVNRVRTGRRAKKRRPGGIDEQFLTQLADDRSELADQWDREHDLFVSRQLLARVQPDFEPTTWEAFRLSFFDELPPAVVAAKTGLTVNAALIAKSRVLKRLRDEGGEFLAGS